MAAAWADRSVLLLASLAACWAGPPFGHPSESATYPNYDDLTLFLVEEFDTPLDLDTDPIWTWSDGGLSEGQVRFAKENIKFEGGKMIIEVTKGPPSVPPQACSHAEKGIVVPQTLTSGEIRTRHNMFRYGLYEVRMRAPSVQPGNTDVNGNYIATMFAFRDAKFKHWREIDIEVTGDTPSSVTMNVLRAENTAKWNEQIQSTKQYNASGQNVRAQFHDYAFDWRPWGITWYLDGKVIGQHKPTDKLGVPETSAKVMMNTWIFGTLYNFGGKEGANNRYPMRTEYEWFRFWKWEGDAQYPCPDMSTACLTPDDMYLSSNNPCDGIPQEGLIYGQAPCRASCPKPHSRTVLRSNASAAVGEVLFP